MFPIRCVPSDSHSEDAKPAQRPELRHAAGKLKTVCSAFKILARRRPELKDDGVTRRDGLAAQRSRIE
jgi:hypothetical protein